MKIAIVGAGGVGGYFGARLAAAGCDVRFIARGAHLAAMQNQGLRIRSPLGDLHVHPVHVTADPAALGTVDAVLVAVKLWDTEAVAACLKPLLAEHTAVISLQNGVEQDEVLARHIDKRHLVGGTCYIAASISEPGTITHAGTMARVTIGEINGQHSLRCNALLDVLNNANVSASLSTDIRRARWEKFVFLVGLSAATTLLRLPIGPIRSDPNARKLLFDAMQETVAVGVAKGIQLDHAYADERLAFCDSLPPTMVASMHFDLVHGNRLELEWLSGAVVRFGVELGIPTPVNETTYAALKLHAAGSPKAF